MVIRKHKSEHLALVKLLLLCCLFAASANATASEKGPCWINSPENSITSGFVGVAAKYSAVKNASLLKARRQAATRLLEFHQMTVPSLSDQELFSDSVKVNQRQSIFFAPEHRNRTTLFSYAFLSSPQLVDEQLHQLQRVCLLQSCQFAQCQPSWLCNSESGNVIGVSNRTAFPSEQFNIAQRVATTLFQRTRHTEVDHSATQISRSQDQYITSETQYSSSQFNTISEQQLALRPKNMCWTPRFVFAEFAPRDQSLFSVTKKSFKQWLADPSLDDVVGSVGIFDGYDSTGLVSNKIDLAIKDGLVQLAAAQNVAIDHAEVVKNDDQGKYYLSRTEEKSQAVVSAQLLDLKIVERNNKLIIYAWLMPTKENQNET